MLRASSAVRRSPRAARRKTSSARSASRWTPCALKIHSDCRASRLTSVVRPASAWTRPRSVERLVQKALVFAQRRLEGEHADRVEEARVARGPGFPQRQGAGEGVGGGAGLAPDTPRVRDVRQRVALEARSPPRIAGHPPRDLPGQLRERDGFAGVVRRRCEALVAEQSAESPVLELRDLPDEGQALLRPVREETRPPGGGAPQRLDGPPENIEAIEPGAGEFPGQPFHLGDARADPRLNPVAFFLSLARPGRPRSDLLDQGQSVVDRLRRAAHGGHQLVAPRARQRLLAALELGDGPGGHPRRPPELLLRGFADGADDAQREVEGRIGRLRHGVL